MNRFTSCLTAAAMAFSMATTASAQVNAADSVMNHAGGHRLSVGGYGEVALSREFYSDNVYRYANPYQYSKDPSHGRFDIPHAVIYLGYDFGKGWTMGSEIEFEHTGTGSANEKEYTEGGEWEAEIEKGGEVELEQFWINKQFAKWANIKVGHMVVPVGMTNAYHEPLNFFTVYRPEGEATVLPCTWHDTGISFWGQTKNWKYQLFFIAGLDALQFNRENWIQSGAGSSYEFKVANKYGFAARVDNYSIPGLRLGISGYYGRAMHNGYPHDLEGDAFDANTQEFTGAKKQYDNVKGTVAIGTFDFTLNRFNWIVRGNVDYGYVGDASTINIIKRNYSANSAPYQKTPVGKNAVVAAVEGGYNIFSQIDKLRNSQKLYLFGRYAYYNTYIPASDQVHYEYTKKNVMTFGVNYYPLKQIAVKAEYSKRFLAHGFNNEPAVSLGIAYEGFFL